MGRPKQFIELLGRPALHYTLQAFEESPEIARIYTVGDEQRIEALVQAAGISKYAACAEPARSAGGEPAADAALLPPAST